MRELTEREQRWINGLAPFDRDNERIIMATFAYLGQPSSYLDIGCGTGAMVNLARKLGVAAHGVDILPRPEGHFTEHDLATPLDLGYVFHLVTSLEVAEHIAPEASEVYCDTVVRHVAPDGILVFSAAHPGQAGDGHVAMRPSYEWRRLLDARGLGYDEVASYRLAMVWLAIRTAHEHLPCNVQVFRR
jgi:SAM-dependent methyltransferase